jgi:hypothetical protein
MTYVCYADNDVRVCTVQYSQALHAGEITGIPATSSWAMATLTLIGDTAAFKWHSFRDVTYSPRLRSFSHVSFAIPNHFQGGHPWLAHPSHPKLEKQLLGLKKIHEDDITGRAQNLSTESHAFARGCTIKSFICQVLAHKCDHQPITLRSRCGNWSSQSSCGDESAVCTCTVPSRRFWGRSPGATNLAFVKFDWSVSVCAIVWYRIFFGATKILKLGQEEDYLYLRDCRDEFSPE